MLMSLEEELRPGGRRSPLLGERAGRGEDHTVPLQQSRGHRQ